MRVLLILMVAVLAGAASEPAAGFGQIPVSGQGPPDSEGAFHDLCHGKDLCWLVVVTPLRDGPFIVQAKFPDAKRFIRPEDAYCDRREYWHVAGFVHTLLAIDCAEQWGPDSQGPIRMSIEGGKIKLTYLEWEYDQDCEKAVALLDFGTAKLISSKRWAGVASENQSDCRHLKALKSASRGDGKILPLVPFRSDSVSDGQKGH